MGGGDIYLGALLNTVFTKALSAPDALKADMAPN